MHSDAPPGGGADTPLRPCMFGVLTTDTVEQALNRAGIKAGNKGGEAVLAMIETVNPLRQSSAWCRQSSRRTRGSRWA